MLGGAYVGVTQRTLHQLQLIFVPNLGGPGGGGRCAQLMGYVEFPLLSRDAGSSCTLWHLMWQTLDCLWTNYSAVV
jgi:hypothetical protein